MPKVLPDEREERGRASWATGLEEHRRAKDKERQGGMSRQRLATDAGISRAQLDKYAEGLVTPPGKHLAKFADIVDYDLFEQLDRLGWLDDTSARVAREGRVARRQSRIHDELQRLIRLDAEISDVGPASQVVQPLLQDGWTVRHWRDWRGTRRRMSYADLLELTPPGRLAPLLSDKSTVGVDRVLPVADQAAIHGMTKAEQRLREIALETIGADRFHGHDCYWSERLRHQASYRGHPASTHPGLVMTVPWLFRRRYPSDDANLLVPRGGRSGSGLASLLMLGLPYSGGPDLAALVADEVLRWGYAGVGMLARERWQPVGDDRGEWWQAAGGRLGAQQQQLAAKLLARGEDPRVDKTVWFFNGPSPLIGSLEELPNSARRPAVVHLRLTDSAIDDFLLPEWGGIPGREREDLMAWRDACDAAQLAYAGEHPEYRDDWLTVDVNLTRDHRGPPGEDAREDVYLVDLAGQIESWLWRRFGVRRPEIRPEERPLLALLGTESSAAYTETDIAEALAISRPAAKLLVANVMLRHGLNAREDLHTFSHWRLAE